MLGSQVYLDERRDALSYPPMKSDGESSIGPLLLDDPPASDIGQHHDCVLLESRASIAETMHPTN